MEPYGIEKGTFYVVKVGERFNMDNLEQIKSIVDMAFLVGHNCIAFDLSECSQISSLATGLIANVYKKCAAMRGRAYLINPMTIVSEFLANTKLCRYVEVFNSEDTLEKVF